MESDEPGYRTTDEEQDEATAESAEEPEIDSDELSDAQRERAAGNAAAEDVDELDLDSTD